MTGIKRGVLLNQLEQIRAACAPIRSSAGKDLGGSAFLISPTLALTAAHVVREGAEIRLALPATNVVASIANIDEASDAALLRLSRSVDGVQPLAYSFDAQRGDTGFIYGFPLGLGGAGVSLGVRVQDPDLSRPNRSKPLVLFSVDGSPGLEGTRGLSGAPLIVGGAVVGFVTTGFSKGFEGYLGAVRIQDALELLPTSEYTRAARNRTTETRGSSTDQPQVAVITALDEELDYLLDESFDWSGPCASDDGVTYRHGLIDGNWPVVATSSNSMGLTATAILTAKVLKEWAPKVVAMIGICAGRKGKGLKIGDVIVPTQTFHYQFGSFEEGAIHRELRVENSDSQLIDIVNHIARRTNALEKIKRTLPRGFRRPRTELQCRTGPMASADLIVKDVEKFGEAIEADRKTIAVEMESYAFMKAARLARTRWVIVAKSVSDYADSEKGDDLREYAKYTSTMFSLELIRSMLSEQQIGS